MRTEFYGKAKGKALDFVVACHERCIMFTRVAVCFGTSDIGEVGQRQQIALFTGINNLLWDDFVYLRTPTTADVRNRCIFFGDSDGERIVQHSQLLARNIRRNECVDCISCDVRKKAEVAHPRISRVKCRLVSDCDTIQRSHTLTD